MNLGYLHHSLACSLRAAVGLHNAVTLLRAESAVICSCYQIFKNLFLFFQYRVSPCHAWTQYSQSGQSSPILQLYTLDDSLVLPMQHALFFVSKCHHWIPILLRSNNADALAAVPSFLSLWNIHHSASNMLLNESLCSSIL